MDEKKTCGLLIFLYLFLAIYLLPMFPHGGSANEMTRWATAASIVDKGSFEISWTEPLVGQIVDTAKVSDKTYSNKAPAPAVLAAPFYAITKIFVAVPDASNIRVSWFVMRLAVATFPLLILAFWLWKRGSNTFSIATLLFATPLFIYSLLLFSHVFAAVALYFAFRFLFDEEDVSTKNLCSAGALSGLAVLSEFPSAIVVIVFAVGLFLKNHKDSKERFTRLAFFVLGGLPFAILLMIYNNALFGSPFSMSYAHEAFAEWAEVAGQGFLGISFPTPDKIWLLLFSPARGLFFYSPILILAVILFFKSEERKTLRHKIKVAAIVASVVIMCGHGAPHGGWASGARYLVFVMPLMLDSFFRGEDKIFHPIVRGGLFAASFLLCSIPMLTFPFAPPEYTFPHNNFWKPLLINEGWFTPTLGALFGLGAGKLPILPVILVLLVASFIVSKIELKQFALGVVAGFVLVFAYIFIPNLDDADSAFRRATIAERFFRPANRLEVFKERAIKENDLATLQKINTFEWTIADTRGFAPNDFPYSNVLPLLEGPSSRMRKVIALQKEGRINEAESILKKGRDEIAFARCEFSTTLAIIYYSTGRKDAALLELEKTRALVNKTSRADCQRSLFLLGSLYQEMNRKSEALKAFQDFLLNTENTNDAQIINARRNAQSFVNANQ